MKVAEDGEKAVDWIKEGLEVDLILMDCQMPVMDGFEATRRIRTLLLLQKRHIPIVALTAHAMESERRRCLIAGMDAFITKPVKISTLESTIISFTKR